jgi:hypothetical protein
MSSDHYISTIFPVLLRNKVSDQNLSQMLQMIANEMASDNYIQVVLVEVIETQDLTGTSMRSFITVLEAIDSDHYIDQVIQSFSRKENVSKEQLLLLLNYCGGNIGSDHYLTNAMVSLVGHVNKSDEEVRNAYRNAARSISSETYYGRAMKALAY